MIPFSSLRNALFFLATVGIVFLGIVTLFEPSHEVVPLVTAAKPITKLNEIKTPDTASQTDSAVIEPNDLFERKTTFAAWRKDNMAMWHEMGIDIRACTNRRYLQGYAKTPDEAVDECLDEDASSQPDGN